MPNVALADLRGLRPRTAVAGRDHPVGRPRQRRRQRPTPTCRSRPSGRGRCGSISSLPGHGPLVEPDTDAGLVARDYASLTPLVGVREAGAEADDTLRTALEALYALPGVGPGPAPEESPENERAAAG